MNFGGEGSSPSVGVNLLNRNVILQKSRVQLLFDMTVILGCCALLWLRSGSAVADFPFDESANLQASRTGDFAAIASMSWTPHPQGYDAILVLCHELSGKHARRTLRFISFLATCLEILLLYYYMTCFNVDCEMGYAKGLLFSRLCPVLAILCFVWSPVIDAHANSARPEALAGLSYAIFLCLMHCTLTSKANFLISKGLPRIFLIILSGLFCILINAYGFVLVFGVISGVTLSLEFGFRKWAMIVIVSAISLLIIGDIFVHNFKRLVLIGDPYWDVLGILPFYEQYAVVLCTTFLRLIPPVVDFKSGGDYLGYILIFFMVVTMAVKGLRGVRFNASVVAVSIFYLLYFRYKYNLYIVGDAMFFWSPPFLAWLILPLANIARLPSACRIAFVAIVVGATVLIWSSTPQDQLNLDGTMGAVTEFTIESTREDTLVIVSDPRLYALVCTNTSMEYHRKIKCFQMEYPGRPWGGLCFIDENNLIAQEAINATMGKNVAIISMGACGYRRPETQGWEIKRRKIFNYMSNTVSFISIEIY